MVHGYCSVQQHRLYLYAIEHSHFPQVKITNDKVRTGPLLQLHTDEKVSAVCAMQGKRGNCPLLQYEETPFTSV